MITAAFSMNVNSPTAEFPTPNRPLASCRMGWLLVVILAWLAAPARAQAPVNDSFEGRLMMSGSTNIVAGNNTLATSEQGEPHHAGHAPAASLWWSWVAPDSGLATVSSEGSSFDTLLAAYTGSSITRLTLVGANDDAPGLATSALLFHAVRGTTYHFAVDGFAGFGGEVVLAIRLPVAPTPPLITSARMDWTVADNAGGNVTFSVEATGSYPISFEWFKDNGPLPDATNSSLVIDNASLSHAGDYSVIVSNPNGSVPFLAGVLTVVPRPSNDSFADRIPMVGQSATVVGHNFGASTEPGEPAHAGVSASASIWWSWTAPQNGLARIDTIGSTNAAGYVLDTALAVYAGAGLDSLALVSENDDQSPVLATSQTTFRAAAGVTYQIAVAGAAGSVQLNIEQALDNDYFVNALEFPANVSFVFDDISGATPEEGEPEHAGNSGGRSVWWTWVAPSNGNFVVDTEGSLPDTVLGVYTGSAVNALSVIGADDNRGEGHSSLVKFTAVSGARYYFGVDGFLQARGSPGRIVLNLNPDLALNDDFAARPTLAGETIQVTASNVGASKEAGEPNHGGSAGGRSIWWTWTAHLTGPVIISTRHSTFDTTLAVYTGDSLIGLSLVAENDDSNAVNPDAGSLVTFDAVEGQAFQIAVDGFRSGDGTVAEGTVELSLLQSVPPSPGGNDAFAQRFSITGQTNSALGDTTTASKELGEPDHAGNAGGRSVWWSWVAPDSAPVRIGTLGSQFETLLAVYHGDAVDTLTLVAEDHRSGGADQSIVTFQAVKGVEYQIAVDGFNDGAGAAAGVVRVNLLQHGSGDLHANDNFENATPISSMFPTVAGLNIGASREPGEPAHGNVGEGHSLWWTWTASAEGPVTISTAQSQFDTVLAVYTGTNVAELTLVTENDDIVPGELQSAVTFQAARGVIYRIAVDGYAGQHGVIALTVTPGMGADSAPQIQQAPFDQTRFAGGAGGGADVAFRVVATGSLPLSHQWQRDGADLLNETNNVLIIAGAASDDAGQYRAVVRNAFGAVTNSGATLTFLDTPFNDNFASRIQISGASSVVRGSILGATKESGEPAHGGQAGGRSVWWKWTAPADGPVEMHTLGSSFDTVLAVYQGSGLDNLSMIVENNNLLGGNGYSSRVLFSAAAGQEYQIAIDGAKTNSVDGSVMLTLRQTAAAPGVTLLNNITDDAQWNLGANGSFADADKLHGFSFSASSGGFALKQAQVMANFNAPATVNWEVRLYRVGATGTTPSGSAGLLKSQQFGGVAVTANPSPILFDLPPGWNLEPHRRYALAFRVLTGNSPSLALSESATGTPPSGSAGVSLLGSFLSADGGISFSPTAGVYGCRVVGEPLLTTPIPTSLTPPASRAYVPGELLSFTLRFSETVFVSVAGGVPALLLDVGGVTRSAVYTSGSGTAALVFSYGVQKGDLDMDGLAIIGASANGGSVQNSGGVDANLSLDGLAGSTGVQIEPSPMITSSMSAGGAYRQNFSHTITAEPTPTSYSAQGLPEGLMLNAATGEITGTPAQSGVFLVAISAHKGPATGQATLELAISKGLLTVEGVAALDKVYDGASAARLSLGSATLLGVFNGDLVTLETISATGAFADPSAGPNKTVMVTGLGLTGAAAGNYTLTQPSTTASILAQNLTVIGAAAQSKIYDGGSAAVIGKATLSGIIGNDDVTLANHTVGTFANSNAGLGIAVATAPMTLSGADAANYSLTQPILMGDIMPRELTVFGAAAQNKVYDGGTGAVISGGSLVGIIGDDAVTLANQSTGTFASRHAGQGIAVATAPMTLSGPDAGNYSLTQPILAADITPRELTVVGAMAQDKNYDGNNAATIEGAALSGVMGSDDVTLGKHTGGIFAQSSVGSGLTVTTAPMTLSGADAGSYTLVQPVLTASITPRELTVPTAVAENKVYDGTVQATVTGAVLSGVVLGDDVNLAGHTIGTFPQAGVGANLSVATSMVLGGSSAGNYSLVRPNLIASITPRQLTLRDAVARNKVYDGTTSAVIAGAALSGVVPGDDVTLSGTPAGTFADPGAGENKTVILGGLSLSGSASGNYALSLPVLTANITRAPLTISANSLTKEYGAPLPELTATVTGFAGSDTLASLSAPLVLSTTAGAASPVGVYPISASGAQSPNYDITLMGGTLEVVPAITELGGVVFDGYIQGGLVFFDANQNGLRDEIEPSTTTASNGAFALEVPLDVFDSNKNGALDMTDGVLVMIGGVDVATGLPLEAPLTAPPGSTVIGPVTTFLTAILKAAPHLTPAAAEVVVKNALGISPEISVTQYDPFAAATAGDTRSGAVLQANAQLWDTSVQIAALIGSSLGQAPAETAVAVMRILAGHGLAAEPLAFGEQATVERWVNESAALLGATLDPASARAAAQIISEGNQIKLQILDANPAGNIAAELTRVQGVTQGLVADDLRALAADNSLLKLVLSANTGSNLVNLVQSAPIGDLDGSSANAGQFEFSRPTFAIAAVDGAIEVEVSVNRINGNIGPVRVYLELTNRFGATTRLPLDFNDRQISRRLNLWPALRDFPIDPALSELGVGLSLASDAPAGAALAARTSSILLLGSAPILHTSPASQTIRAGAPFTLSVEATGFPSPTYAWEKNGSILATETGPVLSRPMAGVEDSGAYRALVSNSHGVTSSAVAQVQVIPPPNIARQPVMVQAAIGSSVTFEVTAEGALPLQYQWFHQGAPIVGATNSVVIVAAVTEAHAGTYSVKVENDWGSIESENAELILLPVQVTLLPGQSRLTPQGFELRFQAPATGSFRVETTSDFAAWQAVGTVQATGVAGATLEFTDSEAITDSQRFYRVVAE